MMAQPDNNLTKASYNTLFKSTSIETVLFVLVIESMVDLMESSCC